MKMILRAIFGMLLLITANAWSMDIQGSHSGSWFNKDQSGHGFSFEVLDEHKMVVYWFVYTPGGEPAFLIALADIEGDTAYGTLRQYSGMRFGEFDPATLDEEVWGTLAVTFWGCDAATVTYQSTVSDQGVPYGSGTIDLTRLTGICSLGCSEPQPLTKYGNYQADVMVDGVDNGNAEIMILKNGTIAYLAKISHVGWWLGVGQLTMTGENSFEYEMMVEKPLKEVFQGSGSFSNGGVSLDIPRGYSLEGVIDPAVFAGITMDQITGTYQDAIPIDPIYPIAFHIAEDGSVTGNFMAPLINDCEVAGRASIPDPGFNQFYLRLHWCLSESDIPRQSISAVGAIRDGQIHMISEWVLEGSHWVTFEWTLGWMP